ncbi:MAG: T9SS type A sorting domain-containing protein, partial [Chitinophagales bacterium]|nr:T9SS type A sorting domain-containing protein [Chitinophagales bacterium]
YTKTGDKGQTSLIGGKKVSKSHIRIEAYGTVDELNSYIGLLAAYTINAPYWAFLTAQQYDTYAGDDVVTPRPDYLCEFITEMQEMEETGVEVEVVYCANILTATAEENIAVINKMIEAGLTVSGIEMGNEMFYASKPTAGLLFKGDVGVTYKDCTTKKNGDPDSNDEDHIQGAIAAQAYYDYINGVQNENTACWLYEFQERSHPDDEGIIDNNMYCADSVVQVNDYIGEFKTNFPGIKIGVSCTPPGVNAYETVHNGIQNFHPDGENALYTAWDSLLGSKYNDIRIIDGISQKAFDAYIVHPYFDSRVLYLRCVEDYVVNDANTWEPSAEHIAYDGFTNTALDTRLADAFNCGREEFMNYVNYGFDKYWDYYKETYNFTSPANSKVLWFTEWNIIGRTNYFIEEDDYTNFDPDQAGIGLFNADIFYNTFLQSSMVFNWQHLIVEKALSSKLDNTATRDKNSRVQFATFHSMFNEKPLGPISQKLDLDEPDASDDADVTYKNNQRKRITYYTFDLLKDIYAEDLKWVPLFITSPDFDSVNFHLYGYLDNTDEYFLYVYFDNTDSISKTIALNPSITGKNKLDKFADKHVKYFHTNQLYSSNGYTPVLGHNEFYHADSGFYAPVAVTGFIEVDTNITTFEIPKYAQGYIKLPLKEPASGGKYSDDPASDPCDLYTAYHNMNESALYMEDLGGAAEINLYIYDITGRPVLESKLTGDKKISTSYLPSGIYVYVITGATGTCSDTFVVNK